MAPSGVIVRGIGECVNSFLGAFPGDTVLSIFPRTHREGEKCPKQAKTEEIRGGGMKYV